MKILHVCHNYFPSKGGPQYTMKNLSEKLVSIYGDEVEVVTSNSYFSPTSVLYKKIKPSKENINGVVVNRAAFWRWHYPVLKYSSKVSAKLTGNGLPFNLSNLRYDIYSPSIVDAVNASHADVIMGTTINYSFCNYPFWRFKTNNPRPFLIYGSIHLHLKYDYGHPDLHKARACDCYLANTDFERMQLINSYGVAENKIVTVGTGIDIDAFKIKEPDVFAFRDKCGIKRDDIVIGFIGRLVKGKGIEVLINTIRHLSKEYQNIKLLLAGGVTDYVPLIRKARDEEGLPIILIENFPESEKPFIYNALDIFVLASQSESFGVVFLEAWACKKPVISSRMGATESLLNENEDSLLFNLDQPIELKHKLEKLIKNREMRMQLGENGYKKVINNFTWDKVVPKYRNAYQLAIENFKSLKRSL